MGRRCRTCDHQLREDIDKDLVCQVDSVRALAMKYGLPAPGLRNHLRNHLLGPILREYLSRTPGALEVMSEIVVRDLKQRLDSSNEKISIRACELCIRVLGSYSRDQ